MEYLRCQRSQTKKNYVLSFYMKAFLLEIGLWIFTYGTDFVLC